MSKPKKRLQRKKTRERNRKTARRAHPSPAKLLTAELDRLVAEYQANPAAVFENDSDRLRHLFDHHRRQERDWTLSKACMYPECQKQSVRRSHTIPRGALALIAEQGHVVTPGFDLRVGKTCGERIGIGKASVFPGFCTEHEQLFQDFEREGRFHGQTDYLLQGFRTICRELAIKNHHIKWLSANVEKMRARIDAWGKRQLVPLMQGLPSATVKSVRIEGGNAPLAVAEKFLAKARTELDVFRREFFDPFLEAENNGGKLAMSMVHHELPEKLPVALAGRGNFFYQTPDKVKHEVRVLLNVIPTAIGTTLFVMAPANHHAGLGLYLHAILKGGELLPAAQMIESWMLTGSDHWFVAPRVWAQLTPEEQAAVTEAIGRDDNNLGDPSRVPALSRSLLANADPAVPPPGSGA